MIKTLIVFEDGKPELERVAGLIAASLNADTHDVRVRAASLVTIPEVLASGFYLFGSSAAASPSYAEIARILKGINLAGRRAAYFGPSDKALEAFKAMAADTGLRTAGPDLVDPRPEVETVAAWLSGLS